MIFDESEKAIGLLKTVISFKMFRKFEYVKRFRPSVLGPNYTFVVREGFLIVKYLYQREERVSLFLKYLWKSYYLDLKLNQYYIFSTVFRSSHSQMFPTRGFLKNFGIFTGKLLCWSLFLIKLQLY